MAAIPIKCVVVGESVGKSALIHRFINKYFKPNASEYHETQRTANIRVGDQTYVLFLHDISGWEAYDRQRPLSYPGTHVFLACFSVVRPDSLQTVRTLVHEIRHFCPEETPILLVGTQGDLRGEVSGLVDIREEVSDLGSLSVEVTVRSDLKREVTTQKNLKHDVSLKKDGVTIKKSSNEENLIRNNSLDENQNMKQRDSWQADPSEKDLLAKKPSTVTRKDAEQAVDGLGVKGYIETSAKTGGGVQALFHEALGQGELFRRRVETARNMSKVTKIWRRLSRKSTKVK